MKDQPLVSVAICTYNGEAFLSEQIESILAQTYRNLEVIAVDDNSTDSTISILNKYAAQDDRIKIFKNDENLGFNKNFEKAISLTRGELIAISDQDDIWSLNKIEILVNAIDDNWLIFSNSVLIDVYGEKSSSSLLKNFDLKPITYKAFLINNFVTGHTCLFCRKFIENILPFPEKGFYDWWMGFIAIYHNKLKYIDAVLTFYRIHNSSVMFNVKILNKQFHNTIEQVQAFANYKNLLPTDEIFIKRFLLAFKEKKTRFSFKLLKLACNNYAFLFPNSKYRTSVNRLNFIRKFAKKIKH